MFVCLYSGQRVGGVRPHLFPASRPFWPRELGYPPPPGRYQKLSVGSAVSVSSPLPLPSPSHSPLHSPLPSDERSYVVSDRVSGPASHGAQCDRWSGHGAASGVRGSRAGGHADGRRDPQSRTDRRGCGAAQRSDLAVMPIFLPTVNVSVILFL